MILPKILVTGATGKTGRALVLELLTRNYPVRALVRQEDERTSELRRHGAEIFVADLFDLADLTRALRGIQRVYFLPLMHPHMLQAAHAFLLAARESNLEHIVQMSQWTSNAQHPTPMTRQTWLLDHLFSLLPGVGHTILNPGMFADNFLRVIDFASLLGIYPNLMGPSESAPISNEDIARAAAALLIDGPERHAGKRYRPTGPELLNSRTIASIIARVVGHPVLPIDLPLFLFHKVARQQNVDPYTVYLLTHYVGDARLGAFSFEGGVTRVMEDLTGQPAEPFETTARRYAALPFARPTFSNRLRAAFNFILTPFVPSGEVHSYATRMGFPLPQETQYCLENSEWIESHRAQMQEQKIRRPLTPQTDSRPLTYNLTARYEIA